jgi:hypothetical protein
VGAVNHNPIVDEYFENCVRRFCAQNCYLRKHAGKTRKVHHFACLIGKIEEEYAARTGSEGGKKGGPARAASLSAERRTEIAVKAARTRWGSLPKEEEPS